MARWIERLADDLHARALHDAGVDRVAQVDGVEAAARIHVEHGGEAGVEVDLRVRQRAQRPLREAALPPVFTWTWASIMPGITVAAPRSITRAPAGICTAGADSVMRSPLISTI